MGDIFIFNPTDNPLPTPGQRNNKASGTAVKNNSSVGPRRKGLSDITNLESKQKVVEKDGKESLVVDQEIIQQLVQENAALMKQLVERNKTIQLCGMELQKLRMELQKLRVNLQSYQQQNLQLAQANTQLLAQVNAGKDKLRVLGHELACKSSLLAVRYSGLLNTMYREAGTSSLADGNINKPCTTNNKQLSQGAVAKGASDEEDLDPCRKRVRQRRQSSRFESEDVELAEDTLNENDVSLPENLQNADKGPKACPASDTSQERSCSVKHPSKAKRRSTAKGASNQDNCKPRSWALYMPRRRTRSSIPKEDATSLSDSVNGKDVEKDELDSSVVQEVERVQDVQITLEDDNPSCSCAESGQRRGPSTAKRASGVEDAEFKRVRQRRQSLRFESEDVELAEDTLNENDVSLPKNLQNADKGPKACPESDKSQERSCSEKHPAKAKRRSTVKDASNQDNCKPKRPRRRTRSSMPKEDAISVSDSVIAKDVEKDELDLSLVQEVGRVQDVQITLEHDNPCCSCTESEQRGPSTDEQISQVEDAEFKREKEETNVFPEQTKRFSVRRPVRRAAEKVQCYKEAPLNVKMRRTD